MLCLSRRLCAEEERRRKVPKPKKRKAKRSGAVQLVGTSKSNKMLKKLLNLRPENQEDAAIDEWRCRELRRPGKSSGGRVWGRGLGGAGGGAFLGGVWGRRGLSTCSSPLFIFFMG